MIDWWQHIPEYIDPIAFRVGFFSIRWYALCWLMGLASVLTYVLYCERDSSLVSTSERVDMYLLLFLGAFLGGHIGFILLYQPLLFLAQPWLFLSPFDATGNWAGLSGMSFHGGLVGVLFMLWYFVRTRKLDFFSLADHVALVTPLALFCGRIGNFFNEELPGRVTTLPWGMYFPFDKATLRHPSTLYEVILEGVILFSMLFLMRKRVSQGQLGALFLILYGGLRFLVEFVREPDLGVALLFSILTRGQVLSLAMILVGGALFIWLQKKNHGKLE